MRGSLNGDEIRIELVFQDDENCSHGHLQQVLWHQQHPQHQGGQEYHGVQEGQEPQQHRAGPVKENPEWLITREATFTKMPLKPQQQILATTPHVLTAAPFAPVRPLAPGLPYEERKGERYQLTGLFLFFLDPIIIFFFFCSMRLMTIATHRRSNGARKTWEAHFTTGTRGASRTRVTNRSNFTLKEELTPGHQPASNETTLLRVLVH